MKKDRHYKTDQIDNRRSISKHSDKVPIALMKAGRIDNKIPVYIDESTVIYVKPGADIEYIRQKYQRIIGII